MSTHTIKAGSRGSPLALAQVEEIQALLKEKGVSVTFDHKIYQTQGDRDKETSLAANTADDFFTDTLDAALLKSEIDAAIHSAKDLPRVLRQGLVLFALTKSADERDAFIGKVPFDKLPKGARVAASSPLRSERAKQLNPDIETVDIRGTIEERVRQMEEGYCDGVIVAAIALKRLGLERYIQTIMPWEGSPLQGQLAVLGRAEDIELKNLFSGIDIRAAYGKAILVGAGPGDPGLITKKGMDALSRADCVLYDYLTDEELLSYAVKAQKLYVGKRKGAHVMPQEELNTLIRKKVMDGKTVARLKGGDPFIFGRGRDEAEYLRSYHIDVEIIPGVSSATGIPTSLGIPLTSRGISSSVAFVSGHEQGEGTACPESVRIPDADTLVFLMGLTKLDIIVRSLYAAGWKEETPLVVISRGTRPDERVVEGTLKDIQEKAAAAGLPPPALIIAGETVKFRQRYPEKAAAILYTGTNPEKFKNLGPLVHFPMIAVSAAPPEEARIKSLMENLETYDIILFTSRFAVRFFFAILQERERAAAFLTDKVFIVIGRDTGAELARHHFTPTLMAAVETSRGLFHEITAKIDVSGKKILFPRSSLPNPYLREHLTEMGAVVHEVAVYKNTKPPKRELPQGPIGQVLFTSPSTVRNFLRDYGRIPKNWRVLSKGAVTAKCLEEAGYRSKIL